MFIIIIYTLDDMHGRPEEGVPGVPGVPGGHHDVALLHAVEQRGAVKVVPEPVRSAD